MYILNVIGMENFIYPVGSGSGYMGGTEYFQAVAIGAFHITPHGSIVILTAHKLDLVYETFFC